MKILNGPKGTCTKLLKELLNLSSQRFELNRLSACKTRDSVVRGGERSRRQLSFHRRDSPLDGPRRAYIKSPKKLLRTLHVS